MSGWERRSRQASSRRNWSCATGRRILIVCPAGLQEIDVGAIQAKYEQVVQGIDTAAKPLEHHLEKIRKSQDALDASLGRASGKFDEVAARLHAGTDSLIEAVGRGSSSLESFAMRVDQVRIDGGALETSLGGLADKVNRQGDAVAISLDRSSRSFDAIAGGLDSLGNRIRGTSTTAIEEAFRDLAARVRASAVALGQEGDRIAQEDFPRIRSSLDRFVREADEITRVLDEIIAAAEVRLEAIE